jgi:hypothetical protein
MQRDTEREAGRSRESSSASDDGVDLDTDVDVDALLGSKSGSEVSRASGTSTAASESHAEPATDSSGDSGGLLSGRGVFSARTFLVLLVASVLGIVVGGSVPLVGGLTRYVGLLVVAFAAGLVGSRRRYLEVGLAGALASGLTFVVAALTSLLNPLGLGLLGQAGVGGAGQLGLTVAGIGVGTGLLVSLAGYYFGRDLRDGLTRDV